MKAATCFAALSMSVLLAAGCSKHDSAASASARDSSSPTGTAGASATSADTIMRGTVKDVSDSALTLTTSAGDVHVVLTPPVKVFTRGPSTLARVTDHVFIGVTSVTAADGSQRATEIHIFPEELRGIGEGSRPMANPAGGSASTMTNGAATMTNGAATMTNGAARMTNGASGGVTGGTMTVQYKGGTQTITVPSDVSVTEIAPTTTALAAGASVVIPAKRQPDGTLRASSVMLAGSGTTRK